MWNGFEMCSKLFFISMQITYPFANFPSNWNMFLFILYYFCASWILLHATVIHIYFASLTHMQITLHLADFTAYLFGHPFYFDYQDFISLASDFSFQHFIMQKSYEKCCNWLSHATHFKSAQLDLSDTFCSSIVSKITKMFHQFPPTNNRRHLIDRQICIY